MELILNFVNNSKPKEILIYNFQNHTLNRLPYKNIINFNFSNGNFRMYCWPYTRFNVEFKLNNNTVAYFQDGLFGYYFSFFKNKIKIHHSIPRYTQRLNTKDYEDKKRIRDNYYWFNLHYFFKNYYPNNPNEAQKNQVIQLFNYMTGKGLKCTICRNHFKKYVLTRPYKNLLNDPVKMFNYMVTLHNDVNIRLNKPTMSIKKANDFYKKSDDFEVKLTLVCKPIYKFFNAGALKKFPDSINHNFTIGII